MSKPKQKKEIENEKKVLPVAMTIASQMRLGVTSDEEENNSDEK